MNQTAAMLLSMGSEAAVAAALGWRLWRLPPWLTALAAIVATALTHWALWWLFRDVAEALGYWLALGLLEAIVVVVEAAVYAAALHWRWRRGLVVSLAANVASAGLGLLIYALT